MSMLYVKYYIKLRYRKNQRENTDNVIALKFDNRLIHFNIKTNTTLLKLVNENLYLWCFPFNPTGFPLKRNIANSYTRTVK